MSDPVNDGGQPGAEQASGRTVIAETAVAKVAGIAAREVPGVYSLGSGSARALGAIREVVGATDLSQGIRVEVGQTQVAVDVSLVAEYGRPLLEVANQVRAAVYRAVQEQVGLKVIEVNVEVNDVHLPGGDVPKSPGQPKLSERLAASVKTPEPKTQVSSGESA
ncbi:putative alkaline shock family protein YloU [Psychromicrobium silvestre]|uniref:Putative alkaline shock family protein YloU n=1 Tax=Psychromicrobium silvestre TaxID=1645614 RepID=A0A7Y9S853_9MICC|nr:putative alkaline shock family protein YloU [Psychromicrobium silvestre]